MQELMMRGNLRTSDLYWIALRKPYIHQYSIASSVGCGGLISFRKRQRRLKLRSSVTRCVNAIDGAATNPSSNPVEVTAIVTVKSTVGGFFSSLGVTGLLQNARGLIFRQTLALELISSELASDSKVKHTVKGHAHKTEEKDNEAKYKASFKIPADFGDVGAVMVENGHPREMFLKDIVIDGFPGGSVDFTCNSWVHSKHDSSVKRLFFTNKSYLPSQTPSGLKKIREEELKITRGNGEGERRSFERIYDYDVYNDLGDPDSSKDLKRPVLGGASLPYPRRCRTGRGPTHADPLSEKRSLNLYVPRDEAFSEAKLTQFYETAFSLGLDAVTQFVKSPLVDLSSDGFRSFSEIDKLFKQETKMSVLEEQGTLQVMIRKLFNYASDAKQVLRFPTPEAYNRDKFFWHRDEEFARETLAGANPCSIQLVKEWPLRSKLDPSIYGSPESAITRELIEPEIKDTHNSIQEAIQQKKLFILDYHDLLLPFVSKVRQMEGRTLYGSRTLFFLNADGTLKPLAIELTRPPMGRKPQWKQVYKPSWNATDAWLWRFAKAHVLAHDSAHHELINHWLKTHCTVEPYVIATNRQFSTMHPIYRLLHPHLRYTMKINALAREALINACGIIESSSCTVKYSMEFTSVAYDQLWRFDLQALPADLIHRGMATEDPKAPHGLKLTIEDYPFANDGLLLWDAMKEWVTEYVKDFYPNPSLVGSDVELQAWWTEIKTVGHADKNEGWPALENQEDLIHILSTIIWVASAYHASVNFGQYAYGGYFPNRPIIARNKMPTEDSSEQEWKNLLTQPEHILLESFPTQIQATLVTVILYMLSYHSPEEEYIGEQIEPSWAEKDTLKSAFERFNERMKEIEEIIDDRNANKNLKNRNGVGIVPYEVLKPFSGPGVTGKGVPNSISI